MCILMYIEICMNVYTYMMRTQFSIHLRYAQVFLYAYTNMYIHTCIHTRIHAYIISFTYMHMCASVYMCRMNECMYVCMHVCMYVCGYKAP